MFQKLKDLLLRLLGRRPTPPLEDPFAWRPAPVRPRPRGRAGAIAVASAGGGAGGAGLPAAIFSPPSATPIAGPARVSAVEFELIASATAPTAMTKTMAAPIMSALR